MVVLTILAIATFLCSISPTLLPTRPIVPTPTPFGEIVETIPPVTPPTGGLPTSQTLQPSYGGPEITHPIFHSKSGKTSKSSKTPKAGKSGKISKSGNWYYDGYYDDDVVGYSKSGKSKGNKYSSLLNMEGYSLARQNDAGDRIRNHNVVVWCVCIVLLPLMI